ncbi:MAG: AAA family ATPase [Verrucomicrobiota bacterium]|jgi:hypothetical protein
METISISGFGGFKEAKFETAPIMVLIGEQATGKSIVAKLLYFFRGIAPRIPSLASSGDTDKAKKEAICKEFYALFSPIDLGLGGFKISYECNGQFVRILHADGVAEGIFHPVQFEWSAFYTEAATKWSRHLSEVKVSGETYEEGFYLLRTEFLKAAQNSLGRFGTSEQIFVPAGRESFARMVQNIFSMLDANKGDMRSSFDPILGKFFANMEYYKQHFESLGFFDARATTRGPLPDVRQRVENILKAQFKHEDNQDYLVHEDSRRVLLADSSSGQQAALPLLLTLGRVFSGGERERDIYFEEPEAHLFPNSQRQIVELLAAAFNAKPESVRFLITTHSPYILSTFGNLLQAGQRYDAASQPDEKLEQIVPQVYALRPGDVAAYSLGDGQARSIIDPETKLIEGDIIDKVSMDIDEQFHRLLWET